MADTKSKCPKCGLSFTGLCWGGERCQCKVVQSFEAEEAEFKAGLMGWQKGAETERREVIAFSNPMGDNWVRDLIVEQSMNFFFDPIDTSIIEGYRAVELIPVDGILTAWKPRLEWNGWRWVYAVQSCARLVRLFGQDERDAYFQFCDELNRVNVL